MQSRTDLKHVHKNEGQTKKFRAETYIKLHNKDAHTKDIVQLK